MPQSSFTLVRGADWVQVAPAGAVVVQKRGFSDVLLFVAAAKPTGDDGAFVLTDASPAFSQTVQNPVWCKLTSYARHDDKISVLS